MSAGPFLFYDNHVHSEANWDTAADAYHHDAIHCFTSGGTPAHINGLYIFDNQLTGPAGQNMTSMIFLEGGTEGTPCADATSPISIFNNIVTASTALPNGIIAADSGNVTIESNTIEGSDPTNPDGVCVRLGAADQTALNNVIAGCNQLVSATGTGSVRLNHNAYTNCAGSYNCWWVGSTDTSNFAFYQAQTGQDAHSVADITARAGANAGTNGALLP